MPNVWDRKGSVICGHFLGWQFYNINCESIGGMLCVPLNLPSEDLCCVWIGLDVKDLRTEHRRFNPEVKTTYNNYRPKGELLKEPFLTVGL